MKSSCCFLLTESVCTSVYSSVFSLKRSLQQRIILTCVIDQTISTSTFTWLEFNKTFKDLLIGDRTSQEQSRSLHKDAFVTLATLFVFIIVCLCHAHNEKSRTLQQGIIRTCVIEPNNFYINIHFV